MALPGYECDNGAPRCRTLATAPLPIARLDMVGALRALTNRDALLRLRDSTLVRAGRTTGSGERTQPF